MSSNVHCTCSYQFLENGTAYGSKPNIKNKNKSHIHVCILSLEQNAMIASFHCQDSRQWEVKKTETGLQCAPFCLMISDAKNNIQKVSRWNTVPQKVGIHWMHMQTVCTRPLESLGTRLFKVHAKKLHHGHNLLPLASWWCLSESIP